MRRWGRLLVMIVLLGILPAAVVATAAEQRTISGADGEVVALIDGQPVTLESFNDQLEVITANLVYMEQEANAGASTAAELRQFIAFIQYAGTHNVALGSLIVERALYARALEEGYAATPAEIDDRVAQDREIVEGNPGIAPQIEAEIAAYGEETYWSEIYPALVERDMTIGKLWAAEQAVTGEYDARVVSEASISLVDPEAIAPATVEGALSYLTTYWQLRQ